jgi:hypothetical protein
MATKVERNARAELQAWYVRSLLPKLAQAARAGSVDPRYAAALDMKMRAFLGVADEHEEAA